MRQMPLQPKKRDVTAVDLGPLKAPWLAYCAANLVTPSQALRQIVRKLSGQNPPQPTRPPSTIDPQNQPKDREPRKRLTLRLTESEYTRVDDHAKTDGFSIPLWIVALIRSRLTGVQPLGQKEQELLGESNYQLLAIGRNLNQIAKALNTDARDLRPYRVDLIEQLEPQIKAHIGRVSALLAANAERWKIND
jgi:hypothetical protein